MADVLLDIATLRAAKRIMSSSSPRNAQGEFVDLDIVALGCLLEAIVFHDRVRVPNLEHRGHADALADLGDAVCDLPLTDRERNAIHGDAQAWLAAWPDPEHFVRMLGGHSLDFSSQSEGYLVLQAIGVTDKYHSEVVRWVRGLHDFDPKRFETDVNTKIGGEPFRVPDGQSPLFEERSRGKERARFNSSKTLERLLGDLNVTSALGRERFEKSSDLNWYAGSEMQTFLANLLWLAFRTRCYEEASERAQLAYMPHPLRARLAGFSAYADADPIEEDVSPHWVIGNYLRVLGLAYEEATAEAAASLPGVELIPLSYPVLLPYIVGKAGRPDRVLDVAYEVRDSRGARDLREHISVLDYQLKRGNLIEARKLKEELAHLGEILRAELNSNTPPGRVVVAASTRQWSSQPRLLFLKNVFLELAKSAALGALYEVLVPIEMHHGPNMAKTVRAESSRATDPSTPAAPTANRHTSAPAASPPASVGIVVALSDELRELLDIVGDYTPGSDVDLDAYHFNRAAYTCVVTLVGEMGETQAMRVCERLIALWQPTNVVVVGIAAGVHSDLHVGDVYVPPQAVQYLQDAKACPAPSGSQEFALVPGAPSFRADFSLVEAVRAFEFRHRDHYERWRAACREDFETLVPDIPTRKRLVSEDIVHDNVTLLADGHVATGPVVGAVSGFSDWIRSHDRNVKALEMESAAVLLSAQARSSPKRALVIRGISDYGDSRKKVLDGIGRGALRRYAIRNAARLLLSLMDCGTLPQDQT